MSDKFTKKHFVVLSAPYGAGHTQAAKALVQHLEAAGHTAVHKDLLSFVPSFHSHLLRTPYFWITRFLPQLYGRIYTLLKHPYAIRVFQLLYRPFFWLYGKRLYTSIAEETPDTIICTQFTAGELLDYFSRCGKKLPPYWICVTDYTYHPMWVSTYTAGYLLAAPAVRAAYIRVGIPQEKLYPIGIPVRPQFLSLSQKVERTHITVMLGGLGMVAPFDLIEDLASEYVDTPIYVICGKNKKLQRQFRKRLDGYDQVIILGWVDNVHEYMHASIFVVTKTGGLTTTECLVTGTPIYPIDPIPGQETDNYHFLRNHNLLYPNQNTGQVPVFDVSALPF